MVFIFRRLVFSWVSLFAVSSFCFFLIHIVPGDPVDLILGDQASDWTRSHLRRQLGLDQSLGNQYWGFLKGLVRGDLGVSLHSGQKVLEELLQALPATILLAFGSLILSALWGIGSGIVCVFKRGGVDGMLSIFSLLGMSFPVFFLAPLLIWFFAIQLSWLPVSEMGEGVGWNAKYFILPCVSLALPLGAILLKITRSSLLEVISRDYIRTARAKGLSRVKIYLTHALRNALIPIVTILGLQSSALLTGTVIVETIFDWPGVGLLLLESIQRRDYPLVQGCVLLIAVIYIVVHFITDVVYLFVHPQVSSL